MKAAGVIAAGGTGERFGLAAGKQLAMAAGRPIVAHAVGALAATARFSEIVVVCPADRIDEYRDAAISPLDLDVCVRFAPGGDTRFDSVRQGLTAVSADMQLVAIHDGARPLVTTEVICRALDSLVADPALAGVVVGHPSYDTLKEVSEYRVVETPVRVRYWVAQTPQVFRADVLREAYRAAVGSDREWTDDSSVVEAIGGEVAMVEGPRGNIKVTVAEDLVMVDAVLAQRAREGVL